MIADQQTPTEFSVAAEAVAHQQNLLAVRLLTSVLRSKSSMLLWGLIGAVLAGLASLPLKPYYTATTRLLPPQLRPASAVSMLGQLSLGGGDAGGLASLGSALQAKAQGDSFVVLLTAWPVQNEIVNSFHLKSVYHARTDETARKLLDAHTTTDSAKGFVSVSVTDSDPNRAANMANGYIQAVRVSMRDMALTEASQRRIFYEAQLGKAKDDLAQAEASFASMQQSSKMVSLDSQAKTLLESAARIRSQITAQEVELDRLRTYLTDSNPQLQIAETSLSALRGQLAEVESQNRGGFTGAGLTSVPTAELDFVRATREVKYREALYDVMAKQYEASRIDEARTAPVVQVIEPAYAPERKAGPHRTYFVLGGFVLAFFLRLILVIYRFWRSGLDRDDLDHLANIRRAAFRWS